MNPTLALTLVALKMYYRNRQAIFWSLFLPIMIMLIFGVLNFGEFSTVSMGIVNQSESEKGTVIVNYLEESDVIDLSVGDKQNEMDALTKGDRDVLVVIPTSFGEDSTPNELQVFYAEAQSQKAEVGQAVIQGILDSLTLSVIDAKQLFSLDSVVVDSKGLKYVDFLVPGIISMAVMQMGIFSVVFTLIQFREQGVLRRLRATPIRPYNFLIGQVFTRLLVSVVQVAVLLGVGILLFDVDVVGNIALIFLLAILGGALFISIGFAVSGFAKSEEVGAPLANVIALPMMFLSGVFFPTDVLPGVLEDIVQFFPLTFLADGMRAVTIQGASLGDIPWEFVGLGVWVLIAFGIAVKVFRWE